MRSGSPTGPPAVLDPAAQLWAGRSECRLVLRDDGDAVQHNAIGPELLRASATDRIDRLRCSRPPRTAAFTGLDRLSPGYGNAQQIAAAHGFEPVRRGPGGRMAAYHRETLCIDVVLTDPLPPHPAPDPWAGLAALASLLTEMLQRRGIDARRGQVDGEYCPGDYSVNVGGRVKVAGTAARRVRGATQLSAVLMVDDIEAIRAVTTDVYAALPFPLDPSTVGGVAQFAPGVTVEDLTRDFLAVVGSRVELLHDGPTPSTPGPAPAHHHIADHHIADHRPPDPAGLTAIGRTHV